MGTILESPGMKKRRYATGINTMKRTKTHEAEETAAYKLVLQDEWYKNLKKIASQHGLTFRDFVLKSLRLGYVVANLDESKGEALIIKSLDDEGSLREREVMMFNLPRIKGGSEDS